MLVLLAPNKNGYMRSRLQLSARFVSSCLSHHKLLDVYPYRKPADFLKSVKTNILPLFIQIQRNTTV